MDVLLVEPKTAGNVGSIARLMKNFETGRLYLLNPRYSNDDEALGFAMHGRDILERAKVFDGTPTKSIFQSLISNYQLVVATTGKASSRKKVFRVPISPRIAASRLVGEGTLLVLGREDTGLTDDELKLCDMVVTIPAGNEYPILNLSHAAGIILYETWLQRSIRRAPLNRKRLGNEIVPAARDDRQRFHDWFDHTLRNLNITITDEWRVNNFIQAVKNIVERAVITERELTVVRGFLKTLVTKTSGCNII
ncbi:TrmJ/YjtD family RNA methyltransferase [Candidatus Bathyarchaeota archaeon]|nr:TrmJ/YjtD family RNA methyltransferase [Candidatus Bathyarchaeota archaeon]